MLARFRRIEDTLCRGTERVSYATRREVIFQRDGFDSMDSAVTAMQEFAEEFRAKNNYRYIKILVPPEVDFKNAVISPAPAGSIIDEHRSAALKEYGVVEYNGHMKFEVGTDAAVSK